ncbi:MAG: hypothetical protein ACYDCC_11225 [Actinomycetota bacterium]
MVKRIVAAAIVGLIALGSSGANATGHGEGLFAARGTLGLRGLAGTGYLAFVYETDDYALDNGAIPGVPAVVPGTESNVGFVTGCTLTDCISGSTVSPGSPAYPSTDLLLSGAPSTFQFIISSGPAGCPGSVATISLNSTGTGPLFPGVADFVGAAVDPSTPATTAAGGVVQVTDSRATNVTGTFLSCLGSFPITNTGSYGGFGEIYDFVGASASIG